MKCIWADFENNAEAFWDRVKQDAARGDENAKLAEQIELCGQATTLTLSDEDADKLLAYAAALPGWNEGPEYAVCPLIVQNA
jgi:hypothetical protein